MLVLQYVLQLGDLCVVGGRLALHGLYSCSLYYSWQPYVLLACSLSPIMQCIHLLVLLAPRVAVETPAVFICSAEEEAELLSGFEVSGSSVSGGLDPN